MFWMKSCPKCTGDLYQDSDKYGLYTSCMQCGRYLTEAEELMLELSSSMVFSQSTHDIPQKVAA